MSSKIYQLEKKIHDAYKKYDPEAPDAEDKVWFNDLESLENEIQKELDKITTGTVRYFDDYSNRGMVYPDGVIKRSIDLFRDYEHPDHEQSETGLKKGDKVKIKVSFRVYEEGIYFYAGATEKRDV